MVLLKTIPNKHMHLTSKVNLTKRFSEKYKCMCLITRLYGIMVNNSTSTGKILISCKNTFNVKKVQPSKVESYLEVNTYISRLVTTRFDIRMQPRLNILNTSITLNTL